MDQQSKKTPIAPPEAVIKPNNEKLFEIESHLPYRFARLANLIQNFTVYKYDVNGMKDKYGVNLRELRVICIIGLKAPISPASIANLTGMDRATITRAINALSKHNFISSHKNTQDGRAKYLSLTEAGVELCDEYFPKLKSLGASFNIALTTEELLSLHSILDKIERKVIHLEA